MKLCTISLEINFYWQPTNFLQVFRSIDSAHNCRLVFNDTEDVPTDFYYGQLVELWNMFMLEQMDKVSTSPVVRAISWAM